MINWENRYSWTKLRAAISWIIVLLFCVGSYLLFGFIQYKQSELNSDYNYEIDCSVLYPGDNFDDFDEDLSKDERKDYLTCYC